MKKILMFLAVTVSFLGISSVKAADLTLTDVSNLDGLHELFTDEEFSNNINTLINDYKENYYYNYPYYLIQILYTPYGYYENSYTLISFTLYYFNEVPYLYFNTSQNFFSLALKSDSYGSNMIQYKSTYSGVITSSEKDTLSSDGLIRDTSYPSLIYIYPSNNLHPNRFRPIYYSNFDLDLDSLSDYHVSNSILYDYDNLLIPTMSDPNIYTVLSLTSDNLDYHFEKQYDYDDRYNSDLFPTSFSEINLNDYAYVALSLKNYNQESFSTVVQVKGQYCLTPVYNYGLTERKDILNGTQVERCSPYYDNYTPVRTYITSSDLENHSIFYLKSYDTSKDNYVKVDTSVFDVTLITEENKDNPYITVNGKTYPTLPYDELTDTATKSEDEGYSSGSSEKFTFSDIFIAPLEFLKDVWTSIVLVFDLILAFIALLPPYLQSFLYASFTLAIVLGLIKIIL